MNTTVESEETTKYNYSDDFMMKWFKYNPNCDGVVFRINYDDLKKKEFYLKMNKIMRGEKIMQENKKTCGQCIHFMEDDGDYVCAINLEEYLSDDGSDELFYLKEDDDASTCSAFLRA